MQFYKKKFKIQSLFGSKEKSKAQLEVSHGPFVNCSRFKFYFDQCDGALTLIFGFLADSDPAQPYLSHRTRRSGCNSS